MRRMVAKFSAREFDAKTLIGKASSPYALSFRQPEN
jgi:hypothetical protein